MPIDKDRLINEVRNRLDLLFPEPDLSWTEAVKIALCEACKEYDPQCQKSDVHPTGVSGLPGKAACGTVRRRFGESHGRFGTAR